MRPFGLVVALSLIAACGAPAAPATRATDAASPSATTAATPASTPAVVRAAFLSARLTDVRTGEQFALSDFTGKQVLVQAMAVW